MFSVVTIVYFMNYAKVIHDSWQLVIHTPKLLWIAFIPSFVGVLVFMLEVLWQLYLYSTEFGLIESQLSLASVSSFLGFLLEKDLMFWMLLLLAFVIFFAFIVPSWLQGTLILSIRERFSFPKKELVLRQKSVESCSCFFRIFEFHALLAPFEFVSIAFFVATFYRYFHDSLFKILFPLVFFHLCLSMLVQIFFAFCPYFIVVKNLGLVPSLKKSMALVFINFGTTLAIILLMFLVNFRVIINVFVILVVPIGIVAAFTYASSFAITLSIIAGVLMLALAAYLTAILEVFSTAVWERTFYVLDEKTKRDSTVSGEI